MTGLTDLLSKDSAGMFGVTALAIFVGWKYDVPAEVLWMVTILGATYIAFEKVRSIFVPKEK